MIKTFILIFIVLAVFTGFSILIPDSFTAAIDNSLIYFLSALWGLNSLIEVSVLLTCFQILVGFYTGVAIFWIFHWILKIIK